MSDGVTRRSALAATAVVVVGGVAGFVWGRNSDAKNAAQPAGGGGYGGGGGTGSSGAAQPIVSLAKVPAGGGWIGNGVVVVRDTGDAAHAFSSTCTHLGCAVNQVSGGKIFCPCHGSQFDAATGAVVQGPATAPLPKVPVTVKGGEVYPA